MGIENKIAENFSFGSQIASIQKYGLGHINDTFLVTCSEGRYILQRLNPHIFKNPQAVMSNIIKITDYLLPRLTGKMQVLTLVPCKNGSRYYAAPENVVWRVYCFVENGVSLELPESEKDFYQSAVAFGSFQKMLTDFPAAELHETIENFHNTPVRYAQFLAALAADPFGRAKTALPEIEFIQRREAFYETLENHRRAGDLPLKVTHNDTKLNNVMLDAKTREPLCIVDLDTIMPGYSVNDFGDSIRFGASTAAEDEKDLAKVHFSLPLFETYAHGFLQGCGGTLQPAEQALLPTGAKMMTMECGMRFLTDYLLGDSYFKTDYPEHNLVRCRTQLKLVLEMEENWRKMQEVIQQL